jgi:DNA polymerase-3 subunit delta'
MHNILLEGSGTLPMAIAYAQYIICNNQEKTIVLTCLQHQILKTAHPDFIYPTVSTEDVKKKPKALIS